MHKFLLAFIMIAGSLFIYISPTQAAVGDNGTTLQFQYEVIELNEKIYWLVQYEDQLMQIKDYEKTHEPLVQYKQLIEQTTPIIQSIIIYSIFILAFITCTIFFIFTKPSLLKHPLFLLCSIVTCMFAYNMTNYYGLLLDSKDNLRYYFLLLENIS